MSAEGYGAASRDAPGTAAPAATDPAASPSLFDWASPDIWRPIVAASFGRTSIDALRRRPDADLAAEMRARFPALRAFHAARPLDPAPYLRDGIRPLTAERWRALVEDCFLADDAPAAVGAAVRAAADAQYAIVGEGTGPDVGRVHFCADARLLTERDGYHLLYGSLSLLVVAIRVDNALGTDLKAILRRRGEAVIFVCEVKTSEMEDGELAELARRLARHLDDPPPTPSTPSLGPLLGFHFALRAALPPAAILGHYRPQRVVDWVYGRHIGIPWRETARPPAHQPVRG